MAASMNRRSFIALSGAALASGLGLAACDNKATSGDAGSGKVGGNLVMYTPNSETLVNNLIPAFEEKTGIKVDPIQAGTGEVFKKIESEANNPIADVVWGGSYTVYKSHVNNFEPYTAADNEKVLQAYRNQAGAYTPYCLDGSVIFLNKSATEGLNISSYKDLLKPELTGKIISADPANSSSAFSQLTNMLLALGGYDNNEAWNFVRELYTKQIAGKISGSSSAVYKTVADNENACGLSYEDPCTKLVQDGANVEVVYPSEGCVFLPASTAIIKGCADLDQAKAWVDFIVSQEAQQLIADKTTVRPVRNDIKLSTSMKPLEEIKVLEEDYDYVYAHKDEIVNRYNEIAKSI